MGDPIEASAISTVYAQTGKHLVLSVRSRTTSGILKQPLALPPSSKACLMLRQNEIPALATLQNPIRLSHLAKTDWPWRSVNPCWRQERDVALP